MDRKNVGKWKGEVDRISGEWIGKSGVKWKGKLDRKSGVKWEGKVDRKKNGKGKEKWIGKVV